MNSKVRPYHIRWNWTLKIDRVKVDNLKFHLTNLIRIHSELDRKRHIFDGTKVDLLSNLFFVRYYWGFAKSDKIVQS